MTRLPHTLWLVAIGPAVGLIQVAGMMADELVHGMPFAWAEHAWTFLGVALWGIFTPALVRAQAASPLRRDRLARQLAGHAATAAAISLTTAVVYLDLRRLQEAAGGLHFHSRMVVDALLTGALLEDLVIYGAIVGISNAVFSHDRLRAEELRRSELQTALVQAELGLLRSQLDPHFVFNTLNSIAALIRRDPRVAERMVGRLGDFLRLTLSGGGQQEVTLRHELHHLESYLDIQRVRFRDRLRVETRVAPAALGCLVPHLLLQPLLENAVKHGLARHERLDVRVTARQADGCLVLEVEDDGPGWPAPAAGGGSKEGAPGAGETGAPGASAEGRPAGHGDGAGIGLANTRLRLEKLYGGGQRFAVGGRADGRSGARVTAVIPWRRALHLAAS